MTENTQKRLVLYDIDGTLLTTQQAGRAATREAMLEVFGTASTVDTHTFGGKTDWQVLVELLIDYGETPESIGQKMPAFERAAARHLAEIIKTRDAHPHPGALDAVKTTVADPNTVVGLVTGNTQATAPIKLVAAGYDPAWFVVGAYGSESMNRNDLPPMALERAIAHSGWQIVPENVYVIGDTPADIACARALGAVAIAVKTGHASVESLEAAQPDFLIDDMTTLFNVMPL